MAVATTGTLHGSSSYIWFSGDTLGQGATGAVYKARHKRSGETFAVKTFNHTSRMRPLDVQMREFQVMRKINHKNIVKLLAIEEDSINQTKVLIMELCNGGSLFNLVEEPRNAFGMEEKVFFNILGDVASGLEHLREVGIVHRDIKPGNILVYKGEDGRDVFKLTDFGAARELEDEEQFQSLYGTEEYLFPDMYARAVLRRPSDAQFDASVDLWSLGVTMYHVATGNLPFRPFGGRSNKHTMYQMTANKEPGIISGVQTEQGGPIHFSRELPSTCPLSKGAKLLVTPLLAGLMECKLDLIYSFDRFFATVRHLLQKKCVYIFNSYEACLLNVYSEPNERLIQLQEAIAEQTDIPARQQELVWDHSLLREIVSPLQEIKNYPTTSPEQPLFLFYKCEVDCEFPSFKQPEIPKVPSQSSQSPQSMSADYNMVKGVAGILHYLIAQIHVQHHQQIQITQAAKLFLCILVDNIYRIQSFSHQFKLLVEETEKRMKLFFVHGDVDDTKTDLSALEQNIIDTRKECKNFFCETASKLIELSGESAQVLADTDDLHAGVIVRKELNWDHIADKRCAEFEICVTKISNLLVEVSQTVDTFKNDKRKRQLSHNEEQIHRFERHKIKSICDKAVQIFTGNCVSNTKSTYKKFTEWLRWTNEAQARMVRIEQTLSKLAEQQASLSKSMDRCMLKLEGILPSSPQAQTPRSGAVPEQNGAASSLEQDFVVFSEEDVQEVSQTGQSPGSGQKSLLLLNTQLASLKIGTSGMQQDLRQNLGLLQELCGMVDSPTTNTNGLDT